MNESHITVVSFSAPPALVAEVKRAAEADDRNFSSMVRVALREYLASRPS
jgi:predicted DNA-binding ribbon-helix-helix protein